MLGGSVRAVFLTKSSIVASFDLLHGGIYNLLNVPAIILYYYLEYMPSLNKAERKRLNRLL